MKSRYSIIVLFGAIVGALWSVVVGVLSELFRSPLETITVIASGVLTGVIVSIALAACLRNSRWSVPFLGLASLPLGAFLFGLSISVAHLLLSIVNDASYRFIDQGFKPLTVGAEYALLSVVSIFALGLFPLAIFTTWSLNRTIQLFALRSTPVSPSP